MTKVQEGLDIKPGQVQLDTHVELTPPADVATSQDIVHDCIKPKLEEEDDSDEENDDLTFDEKLTDPKLINLVARWKPQAVHKLIDTKSRHREELKRLPEHFVYSREFADLIRDAAEILRDNIARLEGSDSKDADVRDLIQKLHAGERFKGPDPLVIGVRGNSNAGKSFFVNNLLCEPGLSLKESAEEACTFVPFIFQQAKEGQMRKFQAEVWFMERDDIKEVLTDWVKLYRGMVNDSEIYDDDNIAGSTVAGEKKDREAVLKNLVTVFGFRQECSSIENTKIFLEKCFGKGLDEKEVFREMRPWVNELEANFKVTGRRSLVEADDTSQLTKSLIQFTKDPIPTAEADAGVPGSSPWPFVSHVTVHFDNMLLQRGITLIDLPGLSDTNLARVKSTEKHLAKCKRILVVTDYGRFTSDPATENHVLSAGKVNNNPSENLLIVTKIGLGIQEDMVRVPPEAEIQVKLAELDAVKHAIEMADLEWENLKPKRGSRPALRLNRAVACKWQQVITGLACDLKVKYRIERAKAKMNEVWCGPAAPMFRPISNQDYDVHLQGWKDSTDMPMALEYTGINRLRGELSLWPTQAYLDSAEWWLKVHLAKQLYQMECFANMSTLEMADKVVDIIAGPKSGIKKLMEALHQDMMSDLEAKVLTHIPAQLKRWKQKSFVSMRDHIASSSTHEFNSTLRRRGIRVYKRVIQYDWNELIIGVIEPTLKQHWDKFHKSIHAHIRKFELAMLAVVVNMKQSIDALAVQSLEGLSHLHDGLSLLESEITETCSNHLRYMDVIITTLTSAICSNVSESPVMKELNEIYNQAIALKGQAVTGMRREYLKDALRKGRPFAGIDEYINNTFQEKSSRWAKNLAQLITKSFSELHDNVQTNLIAPKIATDPDLIDLKAVIKESVAKDKARQLELLERFRAMQEVRDDSHQAKRAKTRGP